MSKDEQPLVTRCACGSFYVFEALFKKGFSVVCGNLICPASDEKRKGPLKKTKRAAILAWNKQQKEPDHD